MAFRGRRFVGLFTSTMTKTRYNLFSHSSLLPFSTLNNNHIINYNKNLDERFVLSQLTDLLLPLSIDRKNIVTDTQESRIMDDYLSPAEKLRGIFIHKLNGNAAIESALSGVGVSLNVEVLEEVVNRGNLGGEAMVVFFHWAIKQPVVKLDLFRCYKVVLKGLGRRKYFSFMEFFLREMVEKRVGFDCEALFIVLDSYVRARLVVKAVKFFEGLEEFGLESGTESLNVLLECLCRRSHVGSASSVMSKMKGKIGFDCGTYNVVIGGWAKVGRVNEVERFMKEMVDDGLSPDCLTFSYFIEGMGRAGRIEDAVKVFGKLSENGCEADTTVYNAMISNFVSFRELDECMKYYRVMIEKGCSPDINTYTILINAFLKARRVADALELFDELLEKGIVPSTGTVTSFLEPLCRFGPPYAATVIYKKARKVGCELSLKAYKLLLMRLSRFGKCGMILTVWDDMQSCGYSSDMEVYEYVVNGLCNIGQLENAVLVMEEALRKGFCPGKIIYSKLNNKLLNVNKVERAYKLFLKVKDARRCENAWRYWRSNGWHF